MFVTQHRCGMIGRTDHQTGPAPPLRQRGSRSLAFLLVFLALSPGLPSRADDFSVGLGNNSQGRFTIYKDRDNSSNFASAGFELRTWLEVPWSTYNSANGETRPACGDLDGDGIAELVVGLGSYPSTGGWLELRGDGTNPGNDLPHVSWIRLPWASYNSVNGETRPACSNLDSDSSFEIAVGLGAQGAGYFWVSEDLTSGGGTLRWQRIPLGAYCNSGDAPTRPAGPVTAAPPAPQPSVVVGGGTGSVSSVTEPGSIAPGPCSCRVCRAL